MLGQYSDEELLPLSGIQHFSMCPRQWALIHIEQQWADNHLTIEGKLLHENVDNPLLRKTDGRTNIITLRGVRLASNTLGLTGIADAIEIIPYENSRVPLTELLSSGNFSMMPIEYKRGKQKVSDCDRLQVTAQALILEEMFNVSIDKAAIYYWTERHREHIDITPILRDNVKTFVGEMHRLYRSGKIPKVKRQRFCKSCSLLDLCIPTISSLSAKNYLNKILDS